MKDTEGSIFNIENIGVALVVFVVGCFGLWLYSNKSMNAEIDPTHSSAQKEPRSQPPLTHSHREKTANIEKQPLVALSPSSHASRPSKQPTIALNPTTPRPNNSLYPELQNCSASNRETLLRLPASVLSDLQKKQRLNWLVRTIDTMTPQALALFQKNPWNLPFLLLSDADATFRVLDRYGYRAWRLLSMLDFRSSSIEKMSKAIDRFGEIVLDIGEQHGLAFALFFVSKAEDQKACLPSLLYKMIRSFRKVEPRPQDGTSQALALWLQNHDDLQQLLTEKNVLCEAFDLPIELLSNAASIVRSTASDSPFSMRFLLEKDHNNHHTGLHLLKTYGPLAASTLYGLNYHLDEDEKRGALVVIKHRGWDGLYLLNRFHELSSWRTLLKRKELYQSDTAPLLAQMIHTIFTSQDPKQQIDLFSRIGRLEIIDRQIPPDLTDKALGWVPGYSLAANLYRSTARGHQISASTYIASAVDVIPYVGKVGKVGKILTKGGKGLVKTIYHTKKSNDYFHHIKKLIPQSILLSLSESKEKGAKIFNVIQHKAIRQLKKRHPASFKAALPLLLRQHLLEQSTHSLKISPAPQGLFHRILYFHQQIPDLAAQAVLKAASGFSSLGIRTSSLPKPLRDLPWREMISNKIQDKIQQHSFSMLIEQASALFLTPTRPQESSTP